MWFSLSSLLRYDNPVRTGQEWKEGNDLGVTGKPESDGGLDWGMALELDWNR